MSVLSVLNLWPLFFRSAQAEPEGAETAPPEASTEEQAEPTTNELQLEQARPSEDTAQEVTIERTLDPIVSFAETTEKATEAATEFVGWVGSGELEALIALALVIGFTAFQITARWLIMRSVKRVPRDNDYSLIAIAQRVVKRFHIYFIFAIALAVTDSILSLPGAVSGFISVYFVLALVIQIAEWVQEFAVSAIKRSVHRGGGDAKALASAVNIIKYFITLIIWTIALLLIMSNVGMDVTALLAGLGIGGIAIGIASQGIFRDLFSSLSIIIDKPFQIGDEVRYGESWGHIEEIGLKTTRIRARTGEQLIISNTNLLDYEIRNISRMARRRIETEFGVIYQTDPDMADRIPGIVAGMFKDLQGVEFDRCGMSTFGPSSLDYTLVFYSLNPDYNRSMAARSKVLLALFRTFKDEGLEFAYPTQTLYLEGLKDD